jgi:hypothetical protein
LSFLFEIKSNSNLTYCDKSCSTRNIGCDDNVLDTRCPAMFQGHNRKVRAELYMKSLVDYHKDDIDVLKVLRQNQYLHVVTNTGHDKRAMLFSKYCTKAIFGRFTTDTYNKCDRSLISSGTNNNSTNTVRTQPEMKVWFVAQSSSTLCSCTEIPAVLSLILLLMMIR